MKNKRIISILIIVLLVLLIPLVAMQFSKEVDWTAFDFFVMGVLLTSTGLSVEFVLRRFKSNKMRFILCGLLLFGFLLLWVELSTGLFGTYISGS